MRHLGDMSPIYCMSLLAQLAFYSFDSIIVTHNLFFFIIIFDFLIALSRIANTRIKKILVLPAIKPVKLAV